MYLFFDTETTGLPNFNLPLTAPEQPHIVSIAMVLTDESGREMSVYKSPTLPAGWAVDESGRAYEVNKLGNEALNKYGLDFKIALSMFRLFSDKATMKIAHNYRFDGFLMKAAHEKLGIDPGPAIDKYCTMIGIKAVTGKGGLADAYLSCFGKPHENAHDALADVRACKDVFFWLKEKGHYKPQERKIPAGAAA